MTNIKYEDQVVENPQKINGEIKEEGECSEDEEKSKDLKKSTRYSLGESRFLLEETTGMYYDQVTGYYYNLVSMVNFLIDIIHLLNYIFNYRITDCFMTETRDVITILM